MLHLHRASQGFSRLCVDDKQMQLIKDRFSLLSFATGNSELALQKLRALKENAAKLNALRKMDKLYGNGKK